MVREKWNSENSPDLSRAGILGPGGCLSQVCLSICMAGMVAMIRPKQFEGDHLQGLERENPRWVVWWLPARPSSLFKNSTATPLDLVNARVPSSHLIPRRNLQPPAFCIDEPLNYHESESRHSAFQLFSLTLLYEDHAGSLCYSFSCLISSIQDSQKLGPRWIS